MMVAYHMFVIGGLVVSIILLVSVVRAQVKQNRWWLENFEVSAILGLVDDDDAEPELTEFEQEVADLTDPTLG